MKITKVSTYRVLPRWMFVKIETDEGISGWGEPVVEGHAKTVEAAEKILLILMIFGRCCTVHAFIAAVL